MAARPPFDVSLVMPCYDEQDALPRTAPAMARVFADAGVRLQLVLVDNGSTDGTAAVIDRLIADGLPVTRVDLATNRGYGGGIRAGLDACRAPVLGYTCADGQVSAADTLLVYQLMAGREDRVLAKARRRFRQDSWRRKLVSITYNGLMQGLYAGLGSIDVNGSPKLFSRRSFTRLAPSSDDWFLDPEIVIKAHELGLRILEIDVEGQPRQGGRSHVDLGTCAEFCGNLARYRAGRALAGWRAARAVAPSEPGETARAADAADVPAPADAGEPGPLPGVRIVDTRRFEDGRGSLHVVLAGAQAHRDLSRGEVYVTAARAGQRRGGHLHRRMGEWFAVVEGRGALELTDPATGARATIPLDARSPRTIYVPPGIAHTLRNADGRRRLLCVAWAEGEHDPDDVVPSPADGERG